MQEEHALQYWYSYTYICPPIIIIPRGGKTHKLSSGQLSIGYSYVATGVVLYTTELVAHVVSTYDLPH